MKDQLIFDISASGLKGYQPAVSDLPAAEFPEQYRRQSDPGFPEVSELDLARHYTRLSVMNHHVDKDLYPLGSCTMKYNPKLNERMAGAFNFSQAHPALPEECVQGNLEVLWELQEDLKKITGFSAATLQPAAGAHGELTSMMMIRRYHEDRGNPRKKVIIPDSSHGTNPASIHFAGYDVLELKSNARGQIDLDELAQNLDEDVAAFMITNPNTLGLFEAQIVTINRMLHDVGALVYMDGANLNALLGVIRPADMGFDVMHINVHKTFSTPHGGGGPGGGPVLTNAKLEPYLPVPVVRRDEDRYRFDYERPHSIGRVHSNFGNFMIMVRALSYIRKLGAPGLRRVSENAIINANYIRKRLESRFELKYEGDVLHEVVFSGIRQFKKGVKTMDMAKRLLDFGFHAPTVYFPTIVKEAIMIEPTETESRKTIDRFVDVMLQIADEVEQDPALFKEAPQNTPVRRVNETMAVKRSDLARLRPEQRDHV